MSRLLSDYCELVEQEPIKNVAISLKLNKDEHDLLMSFQNYVSGEIQQQLGAEKPPQFSMNELTHKLIFNAIRSEKKFIKSHMHTKKVARPRNDRANEK